MHAESSTATKIIQLAPGDTAELGGCPVWFVPEEGRGAALTLHS